MTVIASIPHKGNRMQVEVLDVWQGGSGVKLATVRALAGQPFQSWTHGGWCPSDTANYPADLLRDVIIQNDQEPGKPSLLDLALNHQDKRQWYSGESITLLSDKAGRSLAWLKNESGRVYLQLRGFTPAVLVYILTEAGWTLHPQAESSYHIWAGKAKAALNGANGNGR